MMIRIQTQTPLLTPMVYKYSRRSSSAARLFRRCLHHLKETNHHHHHHRRRRRSNTNDARLFSPRYLSSSSICKRPVIDLRSDTVTLPSKEMFSASSNAVLGDDVMTEDPTVLELEHEMANLFQKEAGIFVPTGTMSNLVALLAHCHTRAAEVIIGSSSHICLWEGGGASSLGGIHTRQVIENDDAQFHPDDIRDSVRPDTDDHFPQTKLLCLENTHNMLGGVALSKMYMDQMGILAREMNIKSHCDGARIFNAAVAQDVSVAELCENIDSVSICLSKGLGAPVGSVLVGETEFIRLAKRARKRAGGGMRQVGVIAAMGIYAVRNNISRLTDDHARAKRIGSELKANGFFLPRGGKVDTNIVYFGLPEHSPTTKEDLCTRLYDGYGVKITGGYSKGGKLFRLVTHLGVDDEGVDRAIEGLVKLSTSTPT
jgi:threonine aldolase